MFLRKSSGGLDLLTEARLARRFQPASGQISHLYGGYLVAELLDSLTEPNDPHPDLYDAAVSTLRNLSGAGDFARILFRFELIVLREVGQLPALEACAGCGQPWPESGKIAFKVSQGGSTAPHVRPKRVLPNSFPLRFHTNLGDCSTRNHPPTPHPSRAN